MFADWNPVSALTQATRELFGNNLTLGAAPTVWPLQHPVLYVLIWTVIILAIFVPLTNAQYRRATAPQVIPQPTSALTSGSAASSRSWRMAGR